MQRSVEMYLREVPFITIPLVICLVATLLVRFFVVPQRVQLREIQGKEATLPELHKEQAELVERLKIAADSLEEIPKYDSIHFTDGASLISELFSIAEEQGITFTRSHPSTQNGNVLVQIGFTNTYEKLGKFITRLEQYPMQLSVSQVALVRKGSLLAVTLTVTGYPHKEEK